MTLVIATIFVSLGFLTIAATLPVRAKIDLVKINKRSLPIFVTLTEVNAAGRYELNTSTGRCINMRDTSVPTEIRLSDTIPTDLLKTFKLKGYSTNCDHISDVDNPSIIENFAHNLVTVNRRTPIRSFKLTNNPLYGVDVTFHAGSPLTRLVTDKLCQDLPSWAHFATTVSIKVNGLYPNNPIKVFSDFGCTTLVANNITDGRNLADITLNPNEKIKSFILENNSY